MYRFIRKEECRCSRIVARESWFEAFISRPTKLSRIANRGSRLEAFKLPLFANREPRVTNSRSGQSLLEVMVALSVLTVGFLGILSLISQSIFISKTVSTQSTATYLAAEGIEIAKNLIDHDVYAHIAGFGTGWGTCFGLGATTKEVEFDYTTTDCLSIKPYSQNDFLYFSPSTGIYSYNSLGDAVKTIYTRDIKITNTSLNPPEITVESIVYWNAGAVTQDVDLVDNFYNWVPPGP